MYTLGPAVQSVPLKDMRPTQITVGFRKVEKKCDAWAAMNSKKRRAEMSRQLFPAVEGPDMKDDPYWSLAASVEERGGFSKPSEPFFEFLWANQFRLLVPRALVEGHYDAAVSAALAVARSKKSRHLPGWAGPR
jgi:hypothetical protein